MASKSKAKAKPASKKPATVKAAAKPPAKSAARRAPAKPPAARKPRARSEFGTIKGAPELASPLPFHPLANIFPLIEGREFDDLTASIKANGLRDAIIVHEGQVLDGRNRQNACIAAGIACRYELLPAGVDALKLVIDKNLRRRQLNDAQRASVAAKIATLSRGRPSAGENPPDGGFTAEQAATTLNVATRQVERARVVHEQGGEEVREALDRGDIPVATAERISHLPKAEQPAAVEAAKPHGARSIMSSRQEPDDSLDFFPTPPWATRALMERVFPELGFAVQEDAPWSAWEPACGEGHMSEVLREYCPLVYASDFRDYQRGQDAIIDFLADDARPAFGDPDWIITNPPFNDKALPFVLRALDLAKTGVAMFFRSQWAVEGIERYETIFRDRPPTLCAFFVERVNLCKGEWKPDGTTATAYCWLVWLKGEEPRAPFWIPPGCREGLTHADDAVRFTMHPVGGAASSPEHGQSAPPAGDYPGDDERQSEITELQALETIEAGREIDIKLPIVTLLKEHKLARGSVKLKLTKLGMKQLERLRQDAYEEATEATVAGIDPGAGDDPADLYPEAVRVVMEGQKASTSYVQRRLQIGYNHAASLMERMEQAGLISAPNHAGKREILQQADPRDEPLTDEERGAADLDPAVSQVDCRVCSVGDGICAECMVAADHVITTGFDLAADPTDFVADCTCGFRCQAVYDDAGEDPDAGIYPQPPAVTAAIKAHWQNVVTEANAAASSISEPDIPESLRRGPGGLAPYQRSEAAE